MLQTSMLRDDEDASMNCDTSVENLNQTTNAIQNVSNHLNLQSFSPTKKLIADQF